MAAPACPSWWHVAVCLQDDSQSSIETALPDSVWDRLPNDVYGPVDAWRRCNSHLPQMVKLLIDVVIAGSSNYTAAGETEVLQLLGMVKQLLRVTCEHMQSSQPGQADHSSAEQAGHSSTDHAAVGSGDHANSSCEQDHAAVASCHHAVQGDEQQQGEQQVEVDEEDEDWSWKQYR